MKPLNRFRFIHKEKGIIHKRIGTFFIFFCFVYCKYKKWVYICTMQNDINNTTMEQQNTYQVIYSDGITVLDYIIASNLKDACQIAKTKQKEYRTNYYKVKRCYSGGVRG